MVNLLVHYVLLLLSPSGYSLWQVWEILYPAIVNANNLEPYNALLKWLRAVSMSVINNNLPGPTGAVVELQAPLADENLIRHCQRPQRVVLPGLYRPQESLERAIANGRRHYIEYK
jgi:hypothetical protein